MKRSLSVMTALALAAALLLPASAWAATTPAVQGTSGQQNNSIGKVTVNSGVVMLSQNGAPFGSAKNDDPVYSSERLMVSANSSATIKFSNGCTKTFKNPGVYQIASQVCQAVVASGAGVGIARTVGALGTAGVIYSFLEHKRHSVPPVSH